MQRGIWRFIKIFGVTQYKGTGTKNVCRRGWVKSAFERRLNTVRMKAVIDGGNSLER